MFWSGNSAGFDELALKLKFARGVSASFTWKVISPVAELAGILTSAMLLIVGGWFTGRSAILSIAAGGLPTVYAAFCRSWIVTVSSPSTNSSANGSIDNVAADFPPAISMLMLTAL
jgi:hypothetical protein